MMNIDGNYEIFEMDLWKNEDKELRRTGYIKISGNSGQFHFICVNGYMKIKNLNNKHNFTWVGIDGKDPVSGNGEFKVIENEMHGQINFNHGDESSFKAIKLDF